MAELSSKEKKRKKIVATMSDNWEIDTVNREIRLKDRPWYVRLWHWFTFKRYTVRQLYIYVYEYFHHPDRIAKLMPIEFPLNHDNIRKPHGVPFNFVMQGGWEIPKDDARKLIKGPLISENGSAVIVRADSYAAIIFRSIWKIIAVLTIPGGLYGTWLLIKAIF